MPSTPRPAPALSLALAVFAAACSSGPRHATLPAPAPAPVAVEAPAPPPDTVDAGFELERAAPARVSTDLLGGHSYDLPVEANRWVEMEMSFLVNQRHAVVGRWLERADRYGAWVRDVLASHGVPRDLHHLAMVESGYVPTARSRAGAVGMWQFMPATGRGMGLRIDDMVDERMDPVRSTHAAARHLRSLHRDFGGDWALAAAAYNAGGGRISRGMSRFGARNFWELAERGDLAQETRHYVPRLYAVTIIAKDPTRYGYPAPSGVAKRFAYDSVRVDLPTPLPELASIAGVPLAELTDLNPHLIRQTAPAHYWVWVPAGTGAATQQAYTDSEFRRRGGFAEYRLRQGDNLSTLASLTGLGEDRIRQINLSVNFSRLRAGDRLRLPADAARTLASRPAPAAASSTRLAGRDADREEKREADASPELREDYSTGLVRVSPRRAASASRASADEGAGDSDRASTRSASREERASEDERPSSRRASASRESERATRRAASREEEETSSERRSMRSSSSRSSSSSSSRSSRSSSSSEPRRHTVEGGETLWGIARKYDVTVAAVREANDLDEDDAIQPGQALRIPRASAARQASSSGRRRQEPRHAEHVVKDGETLWGIARRYDSSVEAIRSANDMSRDSTLQPGQKLRIPRSVSSDDDER